MRAGRLPLHVVRDTKKLTNGWTPEQHTLLLWWRYRAAANFSKKRAACSFLEKFATAWYLFPKPKLTSNAVQIKQANTHMNTFKFYKEVQQQIWGEVVEFIPSSSAVYLRGFGSASPKVRYSDLRTSRPVPSQNTKVKEFLKSVYICQSYHQNKSGSFFMAKVKVQTSSRLTVDNL